MLAITAIQALVRGPKAAALKKQIPSFETTPKSDLLRVRFNKIHGISVICNLLVIAGGIALVALL